MAAKSQQDSNSTNHEHRQIVDSVLLLVLLKSNDFYTKESAFEIAISLPNQQRLTAIYASGNIVIDPQELEDAASSSNDSLPLIPPKLSIARKLLDRFVYTD